MAIDDFAQQAIQARRDAGLLRELRCIEGPQDRWVDVDGRRALMLCSNNYLGLANHPAVIEAAVRAAAAYGVGAGASRLISGSMRVHAELETALATSKRTEAALLFSTGYQANVGTIRALVDRGDAVFSDALNHASIIDGCRTSRARVVVYPHKDVATLQTLLLRTPAQRRLIVTDSVFSMDGDTAPLREICTIAERHGAMVMVDEAHATGALGPHGGGWAEAEGVQERVTVQLGTLGKALGTFGAFVAARRSVIDLLINTARTFIYTTALPPPVVAAASAALEIATRDGQRRQRLLRNATRVREGLRALGLELGDSSTHIVPVYIGAAARTMDICEQLLAGGVFVQGIRPPTVPDGTARLRVTVMSTHTDADLDHALHVFGDVFAASR